MRIIVTQFLVAALLADLFRDMEHSDKPAITPELDLAKLALLTSKDEDEDDSDKGGTETSNDTDATLVEDVMASTPPPRLSPLPGSPSVLGKRPRDLAPLGSPMEVDAVASGSSSHPQENGAVLAVESTSTSKKAVPAVKIASDSDMMFGTLVHFSWLR